MAASPRSARSPPHSNVNSGPQAGTVPDIPGVKAEAALRHDFQAEVASLLGRGGNTSFPGAQPVSFTRYHLEELKRRDYYLCEKTDGIRCLLYCTIDQDGSEIVYLIDRKNNYYYVPEIHFPLPDDIQKFHKQTIIDGELVADKLPGGGTRLRYFVFDCLVLDGRLYTKKPFDKRIGAFDAYMYRPYKKLFAAYPQELEHQKFEVQLKKMEKPYGLEMMFKDKLPNLPHGNDGLVFTCKETAYVYGTDEHILKWKPANENSVDFRLQLGDFPMLDTDSDAGSAYDYDAMPTLELLVNHGREYRKFGSLYITEEEWESMKRIDQTLDGRIIECYRDNERRWRYKHEPDGSPRFRDDKKDGNYIDVVRSVIQSIEDAVSEEDLIAEAAAIQRAWKSRHPEEDAVKRRSPDDVPPGDDGRGLKRARATPS